MSKVKTQTEAPEKTTSPPVTEQQKEAPQKSGGPLRAAGRDEREAGGVAATGRNAGLLTSPEKKSGEAERARASTAMQRSVGNSRLNRMLSRAEEKEDETAQRAVTPSRNPARAIQPLAVSHPSDASEKEAETVARSVVSGQKAPPIKPLSREHVQTLAHEEKEKGAKEDDKPARPPAVQRRGAEEEKPSMLAQRLEKDEAGRANVEEAADAISRKGAGKPLDPALRRALEPRMGADLGAARVHQDSAANEAASAINARAFTYGNDIFLARGESERDTRLMAHELTHVVQQRGSSGGAGEQQQSPVSRQLNEGEGAKAAPPVVQKKAAKGKPAATRLTAPGILELKGMTPFTPGPELDQFLEENKNKKVTVQARFGDMAEGPVEVMKYGKAKYAIRREKIPLRHPALTRVAEAFPDLAPSLIIEVEGTKLEGYIGLAGEKGTPSKGGLLERIQSAPEMLGLVGFSFGSGIKLTNKLEGGHLHLGMTGVKARIGSAFDATLNFEAIDRDIKFSANAQIKVKGLAEGTLDMKRETTGVITGQVVIALQLTKEFSGAVTIIWGEEGVSGSGKIGYKGEKMSGEVMLVLMERGMAEQLEAAKKAPPEEAMAQGSGAKTAATTTTKKKSAKPQKLDYVVFGEGDLTFAFNDWLNGTAHVIVDPKGYVTIIGKITPQKEFPLFEPKEFVKPLFKLEARASYGIPVVGNIFIFASIGMDAFAKLEGKLYEIVAEGTYSTDPEKATDFAISGKLNISAGAGLRATVKVGAGLEILGHDLKIGAGVTGILGIKAYAEAYPKIGYREKGAPGEDKKGEFFIRGDVEIAAQPFLGLMGELFIEVDAPWWSPVDDDRWTWPLFNKEWPLGGSFGVLMSVDYVFGSGQWPAVEFKPAEFDADKFTSDLYHDRAKPKSGEGGDKKGDWKEKNDAQTEPPTDAKGKGNATPGKPQELPPAKSDVAKGGTKGGSKKEANPDDKTASGKAVKEYQEEAKKKGKKPKGKDLKTGEEKEGDDEKDPKKKEQSEELRQGLNALDAVIAGYKKQGATLEEMSAAVKSVRRKFKVFKSIEVVDSGEDWEIDYTYNPKGKVTHAAPKAKSGKATVEDLLGKKVVSRGTGPGGKDEKRHEAPDGFLYQPDQKGKLSIRRQAKGDLSPVHIDKNGFLRKGLAEGEDPDLDKIVEDYKTMIASFKLGKVKEPSWSDPRKQSEVDDYRENMRAAILKKYGATLQELDDEVLSSGLIPPAYNKIRGEIFEVWVGQNLKVLREPRPSFKATEKNLLQHDRQADGSISGTTLVEVKAIDTETRKDDKGRDVPFVRGPGGDEQEQMQDYSKIIKKKLPWITVDKAGKEVKIVFTMVRYVFNNKTVAKKWKKSLNELLKGIHETAPKVRDDEIED